MLRSTFIHLPGIGQTKESSLLEAGIPDWDSFLRQDRVWGVSPKRLVLYKQLLRASRDALLSGDAVFFTSMLPLSEHHRAYPDFREHALYLDLEAAGGEVNVLTITDGVDVRVLVRGVNLHEEEVRRALRGAKMLVTYNGSSFDLPLLKKRFNIRWKGLHVDLKTVARRQGHEGGLKALERECGITRDYEERLRLTLKGGDPALLYRMWRGSGDEHYLRLLLEYNEADAYSLVLLAQRLLGKTI